LRLVIREALETPVQILQLKEKLKTCEERNAALTQQNKELALQNIELIQFIQKQADRHPTLIGGQSDTTQKLMSQIDAISKIDGPVLISGEKGVGKEQAARAIYLNSLRQRQAFFSLACGHLPERALEAELFGSPGSGNKKCLLEQAHRATLLLTDIDQLPASLQKSLLVFLKTKRLPQAGSLGDAEFNVRILATTVRNLREMVKDGLFDEDLYYELSLIPLHVPPLRDRAEDIPSLVKGFVNAFNQKYDKKINHVEMSLIAYWQRQPWPGNVRELEHLVHQMCLTATADRLRLADLPVEMRQQARQTEIAENEELGAYITLEDQEREHIQKVLAACNGNRSKAARILGLKRTTLLFRMEKLGIS
jgi:DNA-binding NtrC family response regulator